MTVVGRAALAPVDNAPVALVETAVARQVGSGPVDKDQVGRAGIAVVGQVGRARADSARREVVPIKRVLIKDKADHRPTAAMTVRRVRRCSRASPSCVRRFCPSRQLQQALPSR